MRNTVNKTLEYNDVIEGRGYNIKVSILSAPEELELSNIDMKDNRGFIFKLSVFANPSLPKKTLDISKDLMIIIDKGETSKLGYIEQNSFIEIDENELLLGIAANVLDVLMIEGNTGSFKTD